MGSETAGTAIELQQNLQSSDIAKRVFVCPMELKHIGQVCLLEQLCFSSPLTERMFTEEL